MGSHPELREDDAAPAADPVLRAAFHWARDAVLVAEADTGVILAANRAAELLTGWSAEDLMGMHQWELHPGDEKDRTQENFRTSVESPGVVFSGGHVLRKDRRTVPVEVTASGEIDVGGRRLVVGIMRDMTEREQVLEDLLAATNEYRMFLDGLSGIAFRTDRTDPGAGFLHGDVERITGHSIEDLMSGSVDWQAIIHPDDMPKVVEEFDKTASVPGHATDIVFRIRHRDGDTRWVRYMSSNVASDTGTLVEGVVYDVTGERAAEEALRASEERFSRIFRMSPDAMIISRLQDGQYLDVNEGFCEMTGFSREEVQGKDAQEVPLWADPSARDRFAAAIREGGEVTGFESEFRSKDGSARIGSLSAGVIELDGETCLVTIARDVTDRKRSDEQLRSLNAELERRDAEREAALVEMERRLAGMRQDDSALLAGFAQELRASVSALLASCASVQRAGGTQVDDELSRHLAVMGASAGRLRSLIDDALDLAHLESGVSALEVVPFRASELLEDVEREAALQASAQSVVLSFAPVADDFRLLSDRGRLREVLLGLVGAAIAAGDEGSIEVTARSSGREAVFVVRRTGGAPGDELQPGIGVSDLVAGSAIGPRYESATAFARRLAAVLGGSVSLQVSAGRAWCAELILPLSPELRV